MISLFRAQPRPFFMIFLLEIWERFGYYTVQGILALYFIRFLGFSQEMAFYTFGAFSAMVYGMVAIGGYLGDKVLGTKRTIVIGLVTLACGYLALANADTSTVFYALGLICVGNGLFKANPSSLLAKCYEKNDHRLHGGFTLYYMSINLGSTVALIAGPNISAAYGYPQAYFLSFIGLLLGLMNYIYQHKVVADINNAADKRQLAAWHWLVIAAGIVIATLVSAWLLQHVKVTEVLVWGVVACVVVIYFVYLFQQEEQERLQMWIALALMLEAIVFFTLYQQMPTSLNLFAVNNVHAEIMGFSFDAQSFQALNPIWIILMSPVLAAFYLFLHRHKADVSMPYKFAYGMFFCGLSFGLLFFTRYFHDANGMVSGWWLVASYLFQSLGELLVSALGVAMVAELVPASIAGFVMGMWFLTSAIAGFTGAFVASFSAFPNTMEAGVHSLLLYSKLFGWIGLTTLLLSGLMFVVAPMLTRYIRPPSTKLVQEEPPIMQHASDLQTGQV
ncbi:MAG: dipeptide/tripeptide permease [Legionellaceae bacterium]|nr:dipeptide/tripeptide permease [Legionellaceae bacterium]